MKYSLKNEQLSVEFESFGGALSSIRDNDGIEYLWQGDKTYWSGQAPVLFPICGSIRGNQAETKDGKTLHMPRHGIVRKKEFSCEEQTENSIVFSITDDESMYAQFPYHFKLSIRYTLVENRICTEYTVENHSDETMPFFIGGHPGFNCPLFSEETYEDYRIEFAVDETCSVPQPVPETGLINMGNRKMFLKGQKELSLSHELFAEDAVILDEICSRSVKLLSRNHEKGIKLDFEQFPYLILWSSSNKGPFIALEPWTGLSTCSDESNQFEEKRNVQFAKSQEYKKYSFTISIL